MDKEKLEKSRHDKLARKEIVVRAQAHAERVLKRRFPVLWSVWGVSDAPREWHELTAVEHEYLIRTYEYYASNPASDNEAYHADNLVRQAQGNNESDPTFGIEQGLNPWACAYEDLPDYLSIYSILLYSYIRAVLENSEYVAQA